MYIPKHFVIQEFVPPAIHAAYGERAWQFLDSRLLETADHLRDEFGPMIINTWHSDKLMKAYGKRTESGLRDPYSPTGAKYSQHKFGRAVDALFANCDVHDVRKSVLARPDEFPYISAVESDVAWFHFDVRNVKPITIFKP